MTSDKAATRRRYSRDFKAQVIAECDVPGASVAKVAMSHGINTNVVHGWRKLAREAAAVTVPGQQEFVPVASAAAGRSTTAVERGIEVELRRGAHHDEADLADDRGHADFCRPGCASCCGDRHRMIRVDAVWLAVAAAGHARRHRGCPGARGQRLRRGPTAPRLPLCQPPSQPHEGARARRHRRVAGRASPEQRQVRLAQGRVPRPHRSVARSSTRSCWACRGSASAKPASSASCSRA